jgi:hypothetical protein
MSETAFLTEALQGLIAAGPVATILGVFSYVLWKQNQALIARLDRQQDKMLKLAVRVQRAVEVLAGIEHEETEVETVLNDDERQEAARREAERRRLDHDKEV